LAVVKNLMVRAGADFSALKKETEKAQKILNDFKNSTKSIMNGIKNTLITLGIGKVIKDSIGSAMGVEESIQQIGRLMGENAGEFVKWANSQAIAFNMSKAEALKYGAVYANLISGFSKTTGETMQYTEELLKASSIIASATGRSIEDSMERIRSGMLGSTEAIEDLGINVNVAMIQSTEAFKKFANGKSWQQLDFQTQQQIRLMAILEQTTKKYGDSVSQNTSSQLAQLVAQLKNVQLSLGQAFLPILNIVLPILTAFAARLASIMNIVAQFSQALFGKSASQTNAQTKATGAQTKAVGGLGDAYKKAGKEAKKAKGSVAGFDEINNLSKQADAGSGGGGGSPLPDMGNGIGDIGNGIGEISPKIQEMANKVKEVFKGIADFISEHKTIIVSAIAGIVAGFAAFMIITKWSSIITIVNTALGTLGGILTGISLPIVAVAALIALFVGNLIYLWQTNEGFRNSVIEVWNRIKAFLTQIVTDTWNIIKGVWDTYGEDIINNLAGFMKSIQDIILNVWNNVIKPIVANALTAVKKLWDEHLKGLVEQIVIFVAKLVDGALEIWNKFISPIINWLIQMLAPGFVNAINSIVNKFTTFLGFVADVASGLIKSLGGIIDFLVGIFTGDWEKAWLGVREIFSGIFDSLKAIVKTPINYVIDGINSMIRALNKLNIHVPSIPGITEGFNLGFSINEIPKLAKGGITSGPMLAMIGDNPGGEEVVSPLDDLKIMLVEAVTSAMSAFNQNDNGNVILMVGETELGRVAISGIKKAQRIAGTTLIPV
jgi:hypothetical protein